MSDMKTETKMITAGIMIFFVLGFCLGVIICDKEPQGIGGFVYKEIEWSQQTYNVMNVNCNSAFGSVGGIFYDKNKKQLYCYQNECVDGGYCKVSNYYFPVYINE